MKTQIRTQIKNLTPPQSVSQPNLDELYKPLKEMNSFMATLIHTTNLNFQHKQDREYKCLFEISLYFLGDKGINDTFHTSYITEISKTNPTTYNVCTRNSIYTIETTIELPNFKLSEKDIQEIENYLDYLSYYSL